MRKIEFTNFELRIGRGQGKRYPVLVTQSPAGEASGTFVMPFSAGKVERTKTLVELAMLRSRERTRTALEAPLRDLKAFGGDLFEALFTDRVRSCYDSSLRIAISQGKGLRLKLNIEPAELASLPWEFLYDKETRKFLALSIRTVLVRYLDVSYAAQPLLVQPPLRLLVIIASPSEFTPLDVEREKRRIQTALQEREEQGLIALDFLENATLPALQQKLREADYHILHFIGHGDFDEEFQQGVLFLEDEWKNAKRVSGTQLGGLLGDHFSLRLVVLNACEGGRLSSQTPKDYDPFSGVAENLICEGIPAVVAMQFAVTDEAAVIFARELYQAVADSYPVDAAVAEARKRIEYTLRNTVEWAAPVLFMRAPDGMLFQVPPRALAEARDKRVARLYGEAREAMAAGQWRQAVALLERVLALDPDHPAAPVALERARAELANGEGWDRAWRNLRTALAQAGGYAGRQLQRRAAQVALAGVAMSVILAVLARTLGPAGWQGLVPVPPTPTTTATASSTPVPPTTTWTPSLTATAPSPTPMATATQATPTATATPRLVGRVQRAVNLRVGPGTAFNPPITTLVPDTEVEILGRTREGWLNVRVGGQEGWVSPGFVELGVVEWLIPIAPVTPTLVAIPTEIPLPQPAASATQPVQLRPTQSASATREPEVPTPEPTVRPTKTPAIGEQVQPTVTPVPRPTDTPAPPPTDTPVPPTPRPATPTREPTARPDTPTAQPATEPPATSTTQPATEPPATPGV
jgi:uncharacterized protein YraI/tetratricopeptide (TPR) repeat protein